jgi:ribosomal protein S12 methylthiotransferase accessory factor
VSPEDLLERLVPHLAVMGITRIANVTGLDHVGIPVVLVTRPNSRSLSVSQGKGIRLAEAKISGVMESIEQFHAEHIEKPLRLAAYHERARQSRVVDVDRLPRSSRPFDERARILWITAQCVRTGEDIDVPYEAVHLDLTEPLPQGSGFFALGSNGLASGSTRSDAVAHALWEIIERDALALFYCRSPRDQGMRRLRLNTVGDVDCRRLLELFERAAIGVAVWDMTSDIGVPAFLCSIGERELDVLRRIGTARGYGCHPDASVALRRALTEAAQSRLTRIAGSRDDIQPEDIEAIRSPEAILRQVAHVEQESMAPRDFKSVASGPSDCTAQALEWTCQRLDEHGLGEILCVDLSRHELPIAVVRVIVPGLEGFPDSPSYVPGQRARDFEKKLATRRALSMEDAP